MQKFLKRFMLIGATSFVLLPVAAFSEGLSDLADVDWSQVKWTQEQAEEAASVVFQKDIREGKITRKQAGEYYKCTEEDYSKKYMNSPEGKKHREMGKRLDKQMNASEKAKLNEEMQATNEAMKKLREQSEDQCAKQLGLKTKPKAGF